MPDLASHQQLPAGQLVEWWEDLWQRGIGPQVVLLAVPPRWGRTTVLTHLAAAVSSPDGPGGQVIQIEGEKLEESAGLQAQRLRSKLIAETQAWYQAADRLSLTGTGTQAAFALGMSSLFVSGLPKEVGFLLAETAAAAVGKIWDDSPAGQDGALARTARAVASAFVSKPVVVLIDDADRIDTDIATTMLQNLAYRGNGQVLAVLAVKPDGVLATTLRRKTPIALTGRVNDADADPEMNDITRAALVRELMPRLPEAAVRRIGVRTRTFADVFAVTSADLLCEIGSDTVQDEARTAADKAINSKMARGTPSPEAVALAWAGGIMHARQAAQLLATLGAGRVEDDEDVSREGSLIRLADPASPRLAVQVDGLSRKERQAMAAAMLNEAVTICAEQDSGPVDKIIAARAVHNVRADISDDDRGRVLQVQCDLVAGLEAVGDVDVALDIAEKALAESQPGRYQSLRGILSAAVLRLRLTQRAETTAGDPLVEELIREALAGRSAIGLEARIWAAINLLHDPGRRESALTLTDQVAADLIQLEGLDSSQASWRLLLAFHAGRVGYRAHNLALLGPLLNSQNGALEKAARIVLRSVQGLQADISLQIAILEPQLQNPNLSDDDELRVRHALGSAYAKLGNYAHARDHAERELALRDSLQGSVHSDTLATRGDLATWTGYAGDPSAACDMFAALVADLELVLGPAHPEALISRGSLAIWTGQAGDPIAAGDQLAALVPEFQRVLGAAHPQTLGLRGNLGNWTGEAGGAAAARDQLAALLPDTQEVLGAKHPDTLANRGNLATWTGRAGSPAAARDMFAALVPDLEEVLGPAHPDTLIIRNNLAAWTGQAGDPIAARDLYAALLPDRERALGLLHPETLATRNNLATFTGRAGDPVAARDQLAALLPDLERVLGAAHPSTLRTRSGLATWTGQAGDPVAARDQLAALFPEVQRVFGPAHPETRSTLNELANWIEATLKGEG